MQITTIHMLSGRPTRPAQSLILKPGCGQYQPFGAKGGNSGTKLEWGQS